MFRSFRTFLRCARERRASVALDFAMNFLPLTVFLFGVVNLGDLGLTINTMMHGVQAASRNAAVQTGANMAATGNPSACATSSQIVADFNAIATPILPPATAGGGTGGPLLSSAWTNANPATGTTGAALTVTASFNWVPLGLPPSFAGVPITLSATQTVIGTSGGTTACS